MNRLTKSLAVIAAVAILLLAGYGGWALLTDDAVSGEGAATDVGAVAEQVDVSDESPDPATGHPGQSAWQEEMTRLCAKHMTEMQPVMEQMMRDMMAEMMDGMMEPGRDGGMMDGMMDDGMMGQ